MIGPFLYGQQQAGKSCRCRLWWFPSCLCKCRGASGLFSVQPWSVSWDNTPLACLPSLISEGTCLSKQIAFISLTSPEKLRRFSPVLDPVPRCGYILGFALGHSILTVDKSTSNTNGMSLRKCVPWLNRSRLFLHKFHKLALVALFFTIGQFNLWKCTRFSLIITTIY